MHSTGYFISLSDRWNPVGPAQSPQIVDARNRSAKVA
jgi:hypothetical protein